MKSKSVKINNVSSIDENHVWLTSSFFYDIKKWHIILIEIECFLLKIIRNEFVHFKISLSYTPMPNIQLAILCKNEETMDRIGAKLYENFNKFKKKYRSEKYIVEVKGIGLPYPSNTFQIGLYQIPFSENEKSFYMAQQYFSKLIFSGLKTESFTEEDTHTLAVYSILIQGKVIFDFNQLVAGSVFEELQQDYFAYGFQIKDNFPEVFNEIYNLSKQLLAIIHMEKDEPWLTHWSGFCKEDLNKTLVNLSDSAQIQIENETKKWYIDKSNLIVNQLGIPQETKETLLSLVNFALVSNI